MIVLYSGTPGSGKSIHQARDVYYDLKLGRAVVLNYEINMDVVGRHRGRLWVLDNSRLTPKALAQISAEWFADHPFREGSIDLYIDEAQLIFNAREWDAAGRKQWISFFTQHRKLGFNVYLVCQFDRMLDRQVRSLIEYEYIHRKLSNFGLKGAILSLLMGGNVHVAVQMWYPLHERIGSEFFRYRPRWGKFYNSYKVFDQSIEGNKT